jgi:hypothetical protein
MRWLFLLPPRATGLYIIYYAVCVAYTAFAVSASVASGAHRARIHRGTLLHLAEGWAFVAVVWGALIWSHYYLTVHTWPHVAATPGIPWLLRAAALAVWVLRPPAVLAPIVMAVTTIVHLARRPSDASRGSPSLAGVPDFASPPLPPPPSSPPKPPQAGGMR